MTAALAVAGDGSIRNDLYVGPTGVGWPRPGSARRLFARLMRASVFTSASLALALGSHLVGGGLFPQTRALLAAGAAVWLFAVASTGRERRGVFVGLSVVVTQLVLHGLFAVWPRAGGAFVSGPAAGGVPGSGGSDATALWAKVLFCHHGAHPITVAQVTAATAQMGIAPGQAPPASLLGGSAAQMSMTGSGGLGAAAAMLGGSWPMLSMLAAHLAAAGVMAWWLRRGERAAWAASRRIVRAIAARIARPRLVLTATRASAAAAPSYRPRRHERVWAFASSERGPPIRH